MGNFMFCTKAHACEIHVLKEISFLVYALKCTSTECIYYAFFLCLRKIYKPTCERGIVLKFVPNGGSGQFYVLY